VDIVVAVLKYADFVPQRWLAVRHGTLSGND